MDPIIEGTSDPVELLRYNWISLGLMFNPYAIMKAAGFLFAVIACAVVLLKCCVHEEPARHGKKRRY